MDAAPAISDGILYAASGDGYVYAFTNATEATVTAKYEYSGRWRIVAHDAAPVYATKDSMSVLLHLNDGMHLPIVQVSEALYEIELPNGVRGWMDKFAFGEFKETDGILFNTTFCREPDGSAASPRRLELIEGAEYPTLEPGWSVNCVLEKGRPER